LRVATDPLFDDFFFSFFHSPLQPSLPLPSGGGIFFETFPGITSTAYCPSTKTGNPDNSGKFPPRVSRSSLLDMQDQVAI